MSDADALYRAILASPDDDTLRLVYADALEESGNARRAGFVRTHVALSHLPEYDARAVQARHHGHDTRPDPHWLQERPLPDGIDWAEEPFRRGLPAAVVAQNGSVFADCANGLFAAYPVEALELRDVRLADTQPFAECPWLQRLTALTFAQGASTQAVTRMLESEHLTRLTELRIGPELTTAGAIAAVVRSRVFRQLTTLGVRNDQRSGGPMANHLAALVNPPPLKRLELSGNRLTVDAVARLVASPAVGSVEDLDLSDNNLGAEGVAALAAGRLPALRSVHLLRTRPQDEGVSALVGAGFFPELRSLSLGGNNLGPAAAHALAGAPTDNLRVLDLRENRIGDTGAASLAENPRLAGLVLLDLAEVHISHAGAEALSESPYLGGLIYLNLFGNDIGPRAADRLRARFGNRVFLGR